ncbi:hypothetical protein G6F37_014170 [Rhizopus arrhizus]|nr:hypothetical protein G6F38_014156 [Rhizopus arrhizus]KAG1128985.1 hypothetical protein G6F37_014170 [Rhizopus arrhizus]
MFTTKGSPIPLVSISAPLLVSRHVGLASMAGTSIVPLSSNSAEKRRPLSLPDPRLVTNSLEVVCCVSLRMHPVVVGPSEVF